ncbi:hypothetical protein JQ599_09610 [Bradyrhizobium diazoefficiens]|nr:hypothetical protein [Bradyrhizobium diazoefficiens]MBR0700155.1 hypothetical protein [Bradyrhizobium diazoefficiens]MBR0768490.1 hypothetical protein [Bradyrhizobium diazoefficiens]
MRKRSVITPDVAAKIEHLATTMKKPNAGKIARQLGLKTGTVYWFMLCNGLWDKKPSLYRQKPYVRNGITINPYLPEHDRFIIAMRVSGAKFGAIAKAATEKFGIPRNAHSIHNRIVMLEAVDDEIEAAA